jgi:hypothetical protein
VGQKLFVCYVGIVDVCVVNGQRGWQSVSRGNGRGLSVLACHPLQPFAFHIIHAYITQALLSHVAVCLGLLDCVDECIMIL